MLKKRIKSFGHAFNGFATLLKDEPNGRFHIIAMLAILLLGFFLDFEKSDWLFTIIAITLVIGAELFNSAIENLADLISEDFHPLIKKAKDLSAAGVLISAICAFIIGLIIIIPKLSF